MSANAYPCLLYDNRLLDGTPTATNTDTGYDVLNLRDFRLFNSWQEASVGTRYVTVNCGSAKAADSMAIIGHNLYTANATITPQYSTDNFVADVHDAVAAFVPTSDKAILVTWASQTKQYWRLRIVTAAVKARMAILCIGARLDFPRYLEGDYDPLPEKINADDTRSPAGYLLQVARKNISWEMKWEFRNLTDAWVTGTFNPAWDNHLSKCLPAFISWERTNHASEVYLGSVPPAFTIKRPFTPFRRSLSLTFEGVKEA